MTGKGEILHRKTKRGGTSCAAINCHNRRYKNPGLSFFRFPKGKDAKDKERCEKWVVNVRRADLDGRTPEELNKNYHLCANHFENSQFMNADKHRLVENAVPTLFDVINPPPKLQGKRAPPTPRVVISPKRRKISHDFTAMEITDTPVHCSTPSPTKYKLKRSVAKLRTQLWREKKKILWKYENIWKNKTPE